MTMLAFGSIAVALSVADGLFFIQGRSANRRPAAYRRIQRHLTNMMAGTIATVTAVMVVNVSLNPVWLPWLPAHHRHHSAHRMVEREDGSAGAETTRHVPRGVNISTRYC